MTDYHRQPAATNLTEKTAFTKKMYTRPEYREGRSTMRDKDGYIVIDDSPEGNAASYCWRDKNEPVLIDDSPKGNITAVRGFYAMVKEYERLRLIPKESDDSYNNSRSQKSSKL